MVCLSHKWLHLNSKLIVTLHIYGNSASSKETKNRTYQVSKMTEAKKCVNVF